MLARKNNEAENDSKDSETIVPIPSAGHQSETQQHPRITSTIVGKVLWVGPLGNGIYSAGQNGINLYAMKFNLPIVITSSSVTLLTTLGLSKTFTIDGIDDVNQFVFSSSHLPSEWPALTRGKEAVSIISGASISLIYSFINGSQC